MLVALLAATAQVFSLVTPATGLLAFVFTTFFVLLLWNTLAVQPDRRQLLRSLLVVFGGAFVLKFVVLAALYEPQGGLLRRVMLTLLEGVSLGTLGFVPDGAATGYLAFVTLGLYFVALVLLPATTITRHDDTTARRSDRRTIRAIPARTAELVSSATAPLHASFAFDDFHERLRRHVLHGLLRRRPATPPRSR